MTFVLGMLAGVVIGVVGFISYMVYSWTHH